MSNTNHQTSKKILVTGGVGYIGSHTCIELLAAGYDIVVYDNLCNSHIEALRRTEQITGREISFIQGDVLDRERLDAVFTQYDFSAVIHFAGLKAVGESVAKPLMYYQNNVTGTLNLLQVMQAHNVKNFVFSSSATVYGDPETLPIPETAPRSCTNPYGQSKLAVEHILQDLAHAEPTWSIACLRYFNPVGAHSSGRLGEDPNGIPNNLMPYISQVAVGKLKQLSVFGSDYDTIDGTGVRDFIHVVDLAKGHVAALDYLKQGSDASQGNQGEADKEVVTEQGLGFIAINLGTGTGTSVLQLVDAFSKVTGQSVPYQLTDRRPGDIAACYASADKAKQLLGWQAGLTIEDMCKDSWHWQSQNPEGYA